MNKGDIGYLSNLKKRELIKCGIQWGAVIAFLAIGYFTTHSKLNLFTIFAVLSCLPAAKTTVGVVVKFPLKSLNEVQTEEIVKNTTHLTVSFDAIITSKEKVMPLECVVISGNTVYGYSSSPKVGVNETANYMKNFFLQNECGRVNVKIFHEFVPFMSRVEGLNNIACIEKNDNKEQEENLKYKIKLISM